MQDQPGAHIEQAQPAQQEKSAATPKVPEVNKQYNEATKVGRGVLETNQERQKMSYGFSLKPEKIPKEYIEAVRSRNKDETLTDADVIAARRGSVGISLESARQLKDGDFDRTGRMNDDDGNLIELRTAISDGSKLCEQVATTDAVGFTQVARRLISQQLSVPPEKVEMTPEQMREWAKTNYDAATGRLGAMIEALREYQSNSPYR